MTQYCSFLRSSSWNYSFVQPLGKHPPI